MLFHKAAKSRQLKVEVLVAVSILILLFCVTAFV